MYWTVAQMVAHHSVNGCQLQPGDLFGSGTLSGAEPGQFGSLLEITAGGKQPVQLAPARPGASSGRRRGHPPRPLQARGTRLDRFRRMSRQSARGHPGRARMKLYTYYRSTSSYRVRIALALKGWTTSRCRSTWSATAEHRQPAYLALNPQGRVPALQVDERAADPVAGDHRVPRGALPAPPCSPAIRCAAPTSAESRRWSAATSTRCTTPACSTCCASGDTTKSRSGSGSATGSARVSPPSSN